jgi:cytosine/uracil/thiamine/allantoin permease
MAAVTVGMLLACCNAYLNGAPGAKHHLGYGMLARAAFGLWGSYLCVLLNIFQSFVFYVSFPLQYFRQWSLTFSRVLKCISEDRHL